MENKIFIKNWEELKEVKSDIYDLKVNLERGCGWLTPKEDNDNLFKYYLTTHTFYKENFKGSTELLQSCGFNVQLDNWG